MQNIFKILFIGLSCGELFYNNASASQLAQIRPEEFAQIAIDTVLSELGDRADAAVKEFCRFIRIIPEDQTDNVSVQKFLDMLKKVVKNPAGFVVVNQIIKATRMAGTLKASLSESINATKQVCDEKTTELKKFLEDQPETPPLQKIKKLTLAALKKNKATQEQLLMHKTAMLKTDQVLILQVKHIPLEEDRYFAEVIPIELIQNQAEILDTQGFLEGMDDKFLLKLTFADAQHVYVTHGCPENNGAAFISPALGEFLFFHELLHFLHFLTNPTKYSEYKVQDRTQRSCFTMITSELLKGCPSSQRVRLLVETDKIAEFKKQKENFEEAWKKGTVCSLVRQIPETKYHQSMRDESFLIVNNEEIMTILGSGEPGSPLRAISENTYRMFHNFLHSGESVFPLRYSHVLEQDSKKSYILTNEMIEWIRSRAMEGVRSCMIAIKEFTRG